MEDSKGSKLQEAKHIVSEQKPIEVAVSKPIISIAFSPDSQYIVTASRGSQFIHIQNQSGESVRYIQSPFNGFNKDLPNSVRKVAVSPNGKFIASSNSNGFVHLWDFESGKLLDNYSAHKCSQGVAVAPDNDSIVSTSLFAPYDILFRSRITKQTRPLKGHTGAVSDITISQNGKFVASCSNEDGTICIWDFTTGELQKILKDKEEHSAPIPDNKQISNIESDSFSYYFLSDLRSVILASDGRYDSLHRGSQEGITGFIKAAARIVERAHYDSSAIHRAELGDVIISPDSQIIASNINGSVRLWDLSNGTLLKKTDYGTAPIAITPDGDFLVILLWKAIHILNIKTYELSAEIPYTHAGVFSFYPTIAISPDGRQIAIGSRNKLALLKFPPILLARQVVKLFMEAVSDPEKLTVSLIQKMLHNISHIEEFRFAYTLLNIQLQQNPASARALHDDIYKCLERLAETASVGPNRDSKLSSKQGADYIARYKHILKTMYHDHFITEHEKDTLSALAPHHMVFSDHRFKELENQVSILKQEIELQKENIQLLAQDLNQLKTALKTKADREFYFGIAKLATMFLANGIVDLAASALNMSDIAKMGATILKIEVKEWKELVKKGAGAVKENLTASGAELTLKKAGFDPDALVDIWVSSTVHLQTTPPSSSPSSSVTTSSPLSHSDSTLESSSSTTTTSPQQSESKQPGNIAQSFATVKSPIMSQPAALERRLSESDLFPIHAAINNDLGVEVIGDLLDINNDGINTKNATGETPLTLAAKQGSLEIATLLVNRKANINDRNTAGKSPVEIAAEQGSLNIVKFLFSQKAEGKQPQLLAQARKNQPTPAIQAKLSS